jgi:TRAP-type C4-dicarboxylate transport system substrate-binding protein
VTGLGSRATLAVAHAFWANPVVLKAADAHPLGDPSVIALEHMGAKLADATGGRLTPRLYPSMQLGGEKEEIEQAQPGAPAWAKSTARRCRPSSNNRGSHENENGPGLYIKPGHDELTSEVQCFVRLV